MSMIPASPWHDHVVAGAVPLRPAGQSRRWRRRSWPGGAEHAYLGPAAGEEEIAALLSTRTTDLERASCRVESVEDEGALYWRTAEVIASGGIVGWFQGRMEWGP